MANILLTAPLNPTCPSGLSGNEASGASGGRSLSWENLIYIADFLRSSGRQQVSLVAGEPTMHPQVVDFILYLLDRGFEVTLVTHGSLSPSRLEEFRRHLTEIPRERLQVVCHFPDPDQTPMSPQDSQRLHRFLAVMGPWTQAHFTIQRWDFNLDFLFEHINRFGLKRQVRLGLAHPVLGGKAGFIPAEDMRRVVERLYSYRRRFESYRVRPDLDCGFPLCQFSDAELGWLDRRRGCGPGGCGPALDIWPDMSVYHCFALATSQSKSLFEFDSLEQLEGDFARWHEEIRAASAGIYEACDGCLSREDGGCRGGGLCRIIGGGITEAPLGQARVADGVSQDRLPRQ